jgi:phospho-2-dehydro-3-deoxyheptonate aldolase
MDDPFVHGIDDRLLVVIGPCSVHDPKAALDYAHHRADQRMQHDDALAIAMPSHFDARSQTANGSSMKDLRPRPPGIST